jgi:hypothetical protein
VDIIGPHTRITVQVHERAVEHFFEVRADTSVPGTHAAKPGRADGKKRLKELAFGLKTSRVLLS